VLQEGKFTTGSYPVVFKPNIKLLATANPVDYTHSGKIIEPLFDRLRSHIHTHYPTNIVDEMLIIVQETQIIGESEVLIPLFIVKVIAKIVQLAREHPDIDHTKGVSVRMAIHSMEILISEVERVRALNSRIKLVPRFCDLDCIRQTSKFELSEMDDNHENKNTILNSLIENAVRDVSLEYTRQIPPETIERFREDFEKNKSFIVSQNSNGQERNKPAGYESQLQMFPALNEFVIQTTKKINQEHREFIKIAEQYDIDVKRIQIINNEVDKEFLASVTELILEGLRWINPPLLDKKGDGYTTKSE
jgi:magnesium chelatase subunit I